MQHALPGRACRWALPCVRPATCRAQLREGHSNRASLELFISFTPLLPFSTCEAAAMTSAATQGRQVRLIVNAAGHCRR